MRSRSCSRLPIRLLIRLRPPTPSTLPPSARPGCSRRSRFWASALHSTDAACAASRWPATSGASLIGRSRSRRARAAWCVTLAESPMWRVLPRKRFPGQERCWECAFRTSLPPRLTSRASSMFFACAKPGRRRTPPFGSSRSISCSPADCFRCLLQRQCDRRPMCHTCIIEERGYLHVYLSNQRRLLARDPRRS